MRTLQDCISCIEKEVTELDRNTDLTPKEVRASTMLKEALYHLYNLRTTLGL